MNLNLSNKRNILIAIGIIVVFFIFLHLLRRDPSEQPVIKNVPWALNAVIVQQGKVSEIFPALGKVESSSELNIAPQISGIVLKLGPREGGSVKKGDLLAQIDIREVAANRDALKAKLISAKNTAKTALKEYQRELKLKEEGGSSQSAVDARETQKQAALSAVEALEKQIKALEIKLSYGTILAPLDASVIRRDIEVGDTAFPGKVIYVLSAHKGGRVIVPVPLDSLVKVKPGDKVELLHGHEILEASITRVNPALDNYAMGSLEIDLLARPFNLPDGSPISVNVITEAIDQGIIVPENALLFSNDRKHGIIFRVHGDNPERLVKIPVEVKLCGREGCAIAGNVKAGDRVVHAHGSVLFHLHDGDAVNVRVESE